MTEMVNGMSQNVDTSSSQPVTPTSTPAPAHSAPPAETQERVFKQSEVDRIVKRTKDESLETYRRMAQEQPQYLSQKLGEPMHQQQHVPQNNQNVLLEEMRKVANEESLRLRNEWITEAQRNEQIAMAQRMANEIFTKLDTGKAKYQDFDEVVDRKALAQVHQVIQLSNMVDNTADVVYDLMKNPSKIGSIQQLISLAVQQGAEPILAMNEIRRLSQALKDNEAAGNVKLPNEPLRQIRPSNTGTDHGVMSVKDYRLKYRV